MKCALILNFTSFRGYNFLYLPKLYEALPEPKFTIFTGIKKNFFPGLKEKQC